MELKRHNKSHVEIRHTKPLFTAALDDDNIIVSATPVKSATIYYEMPDFKKPKTEEA